MMELNIGGIFVSPFVGDLAIAIILYLFYQRLSLRIDLEQRVWHPQLFNLCIFLIILSAISLLT